MQTKNFRNYKKKPLLIVMQTNNYQLSNNHNSNKFKIIFKLICQD